MKKCVIWIMGIFLLFINCDGIAQSNDSVMTTIKPYTIAVSYSKTTNLIFPYAIKSVDRGSGDVLVQKAKGVDNVLQIKAGKENFEQTNVSLITADGKFYSFILNFAAQPSILNICFDKEATAMLSGQISEALLAKENHLVVNQQRFLGIRKNSYLFQLALHGIYLSQNAMWFKLLLSNGSQVDFTPDYVRFFLRDKHKSKRTAIQEKEIFPIYSYMPESVKGNDHSVWTFAFTPFTVPHHQRLIIQTNDKSGGRSMELSIKSKSVLRTKKLH